MLIDSESHHSTSESDSSDDGLWDLYPPKHSLLPENSYKLMNRTQSLLIRDDAAHEVVSEQDRSKSSKVEAEGISVGSDATPRTPVDQQRTSPALQPKESNGSSQADDVSQDRIGDSASKVELKPEALLVKWELEDPQSFPGVPDTEDISEVNEDVLDEALLAFSSLDDVDFLKDVDSFTEKEFKTPVTSLLWRHIIANWKHAEIWSAMVASPCTLRFHNVQSGDYGWDADTFSSDSTSRFQFRESSTKLLDMKDEKNSLLHHIQSISGFRKQVFDDDVIVLTGYICDLGPKSFQQGQQKGNVNPDTSIHIHQKLPNVSSESKENADVIADYLKFAEEGMNSLNDIVQSIVQFSSQNDLLAHDPENMRTLSSTSVKNYSAIKKKADRKYKGDVSRVLDLLRAQLIFPNEGSLICGLIKLWSLAKNSSEADSSTNEMSSRVEILRFKNLFRTSPAGNTYFPALPTGYRHILINIRLANGVIAGKSRRLYICAVRICH